MELNGKVAWVVGASSGIGAAVARELARRGGTVAISARRDEQLQEVSGGHMLVVPLDVTDAASVAAAAARVHEELGPIDLAVLSAWLLEADGPAGLGHRGLRPAHPGQPRRDEQLHRSRAARHAEATPRRHRQASRPWPDTAGWYSEAYGATKAAQINLLESPRVHVARPGCR
jgi:NAD(P)-dependent dehydrogenase (short-subunit alcohol dehydrogenase family)